ncbi:MAG TPA: hypothetical protein VF747_17070, partial [Blastocatellia bacterium]
KAWLVTNHNSVAEQDSVTQNDSAFKYLFLAISLSLYFELFLSGLFASGLLFVATIASATSVPGINPKSRRKAPCRITI